MASCWYNILPNLQNHVAIHLSDCQLRRILCPCIMNYSIVNCRSDFWPQTAKFVTVVTGTLCTNFELFALEVTSAHWMDRQTKSTVPNAASYRKGHVKVQATTAVENLCEMIFCLSNRSLIVTTLIRGNWRLQFKVIISNYNFELVPLVAWA